jgi:hypothetical protein
MTQNGEELRKICMPKCSLIGRRLVMGQFTLTKGTPNRNWNHQTLWLETDPRPVLSSFSSGFLLNSKILFYFIYFLSGFRHVVSFRGKKGALINNSKFFFE